MKQWNGSRVDLQAFYEVGSLEKFEVQCDICLGRDHLARCVGALLNLAVRWIIDGEICYLQRKQVKRDEGRNWCLCHAARKITARNIGLQGGHKARDLSPIRAPGSCATLLNVHKVRYSANLEVSARLKYPSHILYCESYP